MENILVYNQDKTEILTEYDLEKGYLIDDVLIEHIPAKEYIPEKSHLELVKEYPNGGKDYEIVVDEEGQTACEARDIATDIKVYIPYPESYFKNKISEEEKNRRMTIENEYYTMLNSLYDLKKSITDTDYKTLKWCEGLISDDEYQEIKNYRSDLRQQINDIQDSINLYVESKQLNIINDEIVWNNILEEDENV